MQFEGIEKKFELQLATGYPSLRDRGDAFWNRVVASCQAQVLSSLHTENLDAYLLSESSLFVLPDRAVMITCGRTSLVAAVEALLGEIPLSQVASFIYERKNENFPRLQPTSFPQDVQRLQNLMPGTAICFGDPQGHHLHLFHLDREYEADPEDVTIEVLMYGLDREPAALFQQAGGLTEPEVRRRSGLGHLIEGFEIDDHLFEPAGFSMNAIRDDRYYTVHVTPEEPGSYASFESNQAMGIEGIRTVVARMLELFRPRRFDIVLFQRTIDLRSVAGGYELVREENRELPSAYRVQFSHFHQEVPAENRKDGGTE